MNTQHDITAGGQTLDPPTPPRKPHRLLWIDLETTGISRTEAKILEIGMIVTSLDAAEEGDRFICPVHPDHVSLYDLDPKVLRMHLDNGLLDTVMQTEPKEFGYANVARNLAEFIRDESSQYELHPAGTNVDYDIDVLTACGETPKGDGQGTVNNPDPGYVRWYELPDGSAAVRCFSDSGGASCDWGHIELRDKQ